MIFFSFILLYMVVLLILGVVLSWFQLVLTRLCPRCRFSSCSCFGKCSEVAIFYWPLSCFVLQFKLLVVRGGFSMPSWAFHLTTQIAHQQWNSPQRCGIPMVGLFHFISAFFLFSFFYLSNSPQLNDSILFTVYPDGRVCISILHPPGDDPNGYELASERWTPVHTVSENIKPSINLLDSIMRIRPLIIHLVSWLWYCWLNKLSCRNCWVSLQSALSSNQVKTCKCTPNPYDIIVY